jgi:hypothetical protein
VSFAEVGGLNASAVEGLQLPHLPHLVETIQSHSVDGTLLFSVVFAPAGSSYWRWVKNWHLSIERSFSPAVAANRLIVGVGATTCEELARHGILGCVTDSTTQEWWPGAGGGEKDRAVRIKFSWALAALTFGYRVLYNDVDVIYTGLADPLQYLLRDQMREGALPDLQQLSDHIGHAGCEAPLAEQLMRQTLAGSWVDHTLADLAPYPLPCPSVPRFYAPGAACLSTGFWLALPTGPALRFFTLMTMTLAMERTAWEQVRPLRGPLGAMQRVLPAESRGNAGAVPPARRGILGLQQCSKYHGCWLRTRSGVFPTLPSLPWAHRFQLRPRSSASPPQARIIPLPCSPLLLAAGGVQPPPRLRAGHATRPALPPQRYEAVDPACGVARPANHRQLERGQVLPECVAR